MKLAPLIVTTAPPVVELIVLLREVTVGGLGGALYVNRSAGVTAVGPLIVQTMTSTVPALPAGVIAVTVPSGLATNELAARLPNAIPVTPTRFDPLIVTHAPPGQFFLGRAVCRPG